MCKDDEKRCDAAEALRAIVSVKVVCIAYELWRSDRRASPEKRHGVYSHLPISRSRF